MVESALVDWSRLQFALTAGYHWIFVPLTLGLAVVMATMETIYVINGDEFWKKTAKFWMKLFAINFAVGIATGIILEFEFGTNWSNYSWFVGDIFGAPLACRLNAGFVPIRKPNKLPANTIKESYSLEYGTDTIEMHADAVKEGDRVLVIDDLLATGGTAVAACNLVKKVGAEVVAAAFIIELDPLKGREKIEAKGVKVVSMLNYDLD
jgi:hypothetical protein